MARRSIRRSGKRDEGPGRMPDVPDRVIYDLTQFFKLLGDESRLGILLHLARAGELHVTALRDRFVQGPPTVSHQLALLRVAGLVDRRREGKHVYYRVAGDRFGQLLLAVFSADGVMPGTVRFGRFALTHVGTRANE